jgi:hypothetical protein
MWLLGSESGPGPSYEALAEWALAFADALDGKLEAAAGRARAALRLAEETGDEPTIWRASAVLAETTTDPAEAADHRRRATDFVRGMAKSLDGADLKERFLAQPAVVALLRSA